MNEEIVVVRAIAKDPERPLSNFPGGGEAQSATQTYKVETIHADPRDLGSIRRQPDVRAAAIAVPLRLYEPVSQKAVERGGGDVWGLEAVGSTDSICSGLGATIAILDSGIDDSHEAFATRGRDALVQADFTGDGNGDSSGHGTHCAATAFGGVVGTRTIGVAPGVGKALIGKVFGRTGASTSTLARAIEWATAPEQGANVVSMSLGFDFPLYAATLQARGYPESIAAAISMERHRETLDLFGVIANRARYNGRPVLFVAAAGNASQYGLNPDFVAGLEPPAAAEGFVSVSAVGRTGRGTYRVADFSNGRASVCAPGVDVVSAVAGSRSGTVSMSGTSMAAPHVAGVAALWFEHLSNQVGAFTTETFMSRVAGSGRLDRIERDRIGDVGTGIVQAPAG